MESIAQLIQSLSKPEFKFLLHIYSFSKNREDKKRHLLLTLFESGKKTDDEIARLLGYSSLKTPSYLTLKTRVRNDILSMLLMQERIEDQESAFSQSQFECRRSLLFADLLYARGDYSEAEQLLERSSRLAEKYELFGEQILIDDLYRNQVASQGDSIRFRQLSDKIETNHTLQEKVLKARRTHYEIALPRLMCAYTGKDFQKTGAELLQESGESLKHGSVRLKFYHHLSAMNYHSAVREFAAAREHGVALLELCDGEQMLRCDSNHSAVNLELANLCLNTTGCTDALKHARSAVDYSKGNPMQQVQAFLSLFFAHFRAGQLREANQVLEEVLDLRYLKNFPDILGRFRLLQSGLAFREKKFDTCYDNLQRFSELSRSQNGWMPGWYLLETQAALEMGKFNETIHYRMDAFRKTMHNRGYLKSGQAPRMLTILNLMRELSKHDLDFKKVVQKKSSDVRMLQEGKDELWWNPAGYELIRFDEWLMQKAAVQK